MIKKDPDTAPAEVNEDRGPKVNWRVLIIAVSHHSGILRLGDADAR